LLCERSERKQVNIERLQRIMISAMKQSQKAYLPQLNEMTDFSKWIKTQSSEHCYIAHCNDGNRQSLKTVYQSERNVTIAIGPEGDFSMQEVTLALTHGFKGVSLGESRLRTETAGIAACHSVYLLNEKTYEVLGKK